MGTDGAGGDDAPLSDLAREVRERRRRRRREGSRTERGERDGPVDGDSDAGGAVGGDGNDGGAADSDDPFESVETPAVDAESVWETLAADPATTHGVGTGDDSDPVERAVEGDEHVVPKRTYCQQCPHFSAPPAVRCGREGTTVVEVVDIDHFRVRDCPVARDAAESGTDADAR